MKVTYTTEPKTGNIVVPDGAPFDGKDYLIKVSSGWVQARWIGRTGHGESAEGFEWLALDGDVGPFGFDEATEWGFLPANDESSVTEMEAIFRDQMLKPHLETLKDPELLSFLYDADMLPEQCRSAQGAIHLAALCFVWKRMKVLELEARVRKEYIAATAAIDPFIDGPK
jgi:hypothetical protein